MKPYGNGMRNEPRSVGFILVLRAPGATPFGEMRDKVRHTM